MKRIDVRDMIKSVVAATLIAMATTAADAQTIPCGSHAQIAAFLKDKFQELQDAFGVVGDKAVLELYVSDGGATWTILLTDISGRSCILAAGDTWEQKRDTADLRT